MHQTPTAKSTEAVQADLVKRFNHFDNWKDRYKYLIDIGKNMQRISQEYQTEANRIHGCQSQVWLYVEQKGEVLQMQAMSDAAIVSGLIALLLKYYNNRTPQQILDAPLDFLAEIGLIEHLSPNRSTGLYHMVKRIKEEAKKRLP